MILDSYKGREQALIKHTLLRSYLERLFMIVGQHSKTICYVDCFAGPWQEGSDDLSGTSIAISIEIMKRCRKGLLECGKNVKFKALFIEKEKKSFEKLKMFLESEFCEGIETEAKYGEFYHLRNDILKWCGNLDFTFFFIDPKGWKDVVEKETLEPLLKRKNSEYLINFMFDFIRRTVPMNSFEAKMIEIFGSVPETEGMEPAQREKTLLNCFLKRLKEIQVSTGLKPRAAAVKVLDRLKDRTKYYLVYLTRHPRGIQVFMEASEKIDFIQKQVRAQTKQNHRVSKTGQTEMFPADLEIDNNYTDINEVKEYWLSNLQYYPKRFDIELLADMLEETGWFESDLQNALKELIKNGEVENLDAQRIRPKNVVDFNKGEHLKRIKT